MAALKEKERIGKYTVQSLIKSNLYTETYRVEDADQRPFFLKLFILKKMPNQLIDIQTNLVLEIQYCSGINHKNLLTYVEHGAIETDEFGQCQYYVTSYLTGNILSDRIARSANGRLAEYEALRIFHGILKGLDHLHTKSPALCHNDLDTSNIMIADMAEADPEIIDFGHVAERCSGYVSFPTSDLNPLYHANETAQGIFDEQGDIFSACAVLYAMLTGKAPWAEAPVDADAEYKVIMKNLKEYRKQHPLEIEKLNFSDKTKYILHRGLELKNINRFGSIDDVIKVLNTSDSPEPNNHPAQSQQSQESQQSSRDDVNSVHINIKRGGGNGFKDIAGMAELKDTLRKQVIFVIHNKDIAEQYKIFPPNGMLLYGPPGCGKTYFAEKFAEETGFNYMLIKASDIASSWQDGPQQKVNNLFELAEKNTPIVMCFDEFDAVVPDRSTFMSQHSAQVVNEFLTHMNNCSKRGIFIVATSNRPDKIDPAILRTGRLDKQIFVPLPDYEARKEMFNLYMNDRPQEGEIDFDKLSNMTDGFIASDIAYIVNDAAMIAAYSRAKISSQLLEDSVRNTHPSVRPDSIKMYDEIRKKMDSTNKRNLTDRVKVQPLQ